MKHNQESIECICGLSTYFGTPNASFLKFDVYIYVYTYTGLGCKVVRDTRIILLLFFSEIEVVRLSVAWVICIVSGGAAWKEHVRKGVD